MHASTILQKILHPVTELMDRRNVRTLFLAVDSLLLGRRLTLMELARHFPGAEYVHAPLKRLDRFLGNHSVHGLRRQYYRQAAHWLIQSDRPVIIVDWSELKSDGCWHLLRAGIVCRGRTITLYEEVHPEALKGNSHVEAAFLQSLKQLLPQALCPIMVTDAGFRTPWFRAVENLGWHWVGRLRQNTFVRLSEDQSSAQSTLYKQAATKPCSYKAQINRRYPLTCRLTLIRQRPCGRHSYNYFGGRSRSGYSEEFSRSASEPWILAASCSLQDLSAAQVVSVYRKRMQIEQSFRDLKSHRYGCGFDDTLTRKPHRLEMLLLLQMLASLVAWLAGIKQSGSEKTVKQRAREMRHYSILTRGWDWLRRTRGGCWPDPRTIQALRDALVQTL
jgi:hypothetical protein